MAIPKAAMSQRIATVRPDQPAPDPSTALEGLGRGWLILRNCRLGCPQGRGLPSALIHPAVGVALLDILPSESPGAIEAFRARLAAARFPAIFPGYLPVVHLRLAPRQLEELRTRLDRAFAAQPPLSLPGGDAWITAVARALTTEQPVPRLRSRRLRQRRRRRFVALWRLAGAAILATGVLAAVYAATGTHRPPAPAAEASPAESPPTPTADEALSPASQDIADPPATPPPEMAAEREPVVTEPATPPAVAPEPAAPQPPIPPGPSEKQEAAAPRTPKPLPPDRPVTDHVARAGLAVAAGRPPIPPPRPAPTARRPDPEPPQPQKENPSEKPAAFHPVPPREAPEATRLLPIAERVLPPITNPVSAPPPEPPLQHCHRIVYLVGQGVLLPDEELRFFQQACVRR